MKTLKKIKLNGLNDAELRDREMDVLNGGDRTCGCGCNYALNGGRACSCSCSAPGGSADGANGSANYKLGTSGGHSISGTPVVCFTDEFGNGIQGAAANW